MRYLNDESNFSKAGKHPRPGGVVDILEACGAFDPGSSPGRGVPVFEFFFRTMPSAYLPSRLRIYRMKEQYIQKRSLPVIVNTRGTNDNGHPSRHDFLLREKIYRIRYDKTAFFYELPYLKKVEGSSRAAQTRMNVNQTNSAVIIIIPENAQ